MYFYENNYYYFTTSYLYDFYNFKNFLNGNLYLLTIVVWILFYNTFITVFIYVYMYVRGIVDNWGII